MHLFTLRVTPLYHFNLHLLDHLDHLMCFRSGYVFMQSPQCVMFCLVLFYACAFGFDLI